MDNKSKNTIVRGIMALIMIILFWGFFFSIVHLAKNERTAEEHVNFILDAKEKSAVERAFINGYRTGVERYCQTNGVTNVVIYLDDMIKDAREYYDSLKGTNG